MFRRLFLTVGLAAVTVQAVTACAPTATPFPAPMSEPTATAAAATVIIPHADEIRFALVGEVALTNVWAYFDEAGADYNNRAAQTGSWPSLYRISPLSGDFEPFLVEGTFSPFELTPTYITSTVSLRPGLAWSDGSALTAEDVAFTVNTALDFQLGLDWGAAYRPDLLDHAEAIDPRTVRFYFKSQPSVADWQYGVLQGPIVNAAFWGAGVDLVRGQLLSLPAMEKDLFNLKVEDDRLQKEMADLRAQLAGIDPASREHEKQQIVIDKKQEDINSVTVRTKRKLDELEAVLVAARRALVAMNARGEPTFGPFLSPKSQEGEYIRDVNPAYPKEFEAPNFNHAVYRAYLNADAAFAALEKGEANLVLRPGGAFSPSISAISSSMLHPANNIRYLAFNLANPALADAVLRAAIACVILPPAGNIIIPADGLVPRSNHFWRNPDVTLPCQGVVDGQARLSQAVSLLEAAGYAWDVKPAWTGASLPGSGLRRADGAVIPPLRLLGYSPEADIQRMAWASAIAGQLSQLGIPIQFEEVEQEDVLYRVFDTGEYDMVILGWRLPLYPAYLCDLFGPGNPYSYANSVLTQNCEALRTTTDLESARQMVFTIQSLLAADLPVVPLYGNVVSDFTSGISYPFQNVLDGISGLYGAPDLALPSAP
jgi:ABC-type transport system substrate-binding protein